MAKGIHSKKYRQAQLAAKRAEAAEQARRQTLEDIHQKQCPNCGAKNTAAIEYGFPSEALLAEVRKYAGMLIHGGCEFWPNQPTFECNECKHGWK